jgi:hypothetical protein
MMARSTRRSSINILNEVAGLLAANRHGEDDQRSDPIGPSQVDDLMAYTKKLLQEVARLLKLKGYSSMRKEELATRIHTALNDAAAEAGDRPTDEPTEEDRIARAKFDLGPDVSEPEVKHIPWGYGYDRITAMVINPDQLYTYWEVTDQAIDAARRALGDAGKDAWLNLRVYDVTGRIFDGTNAHSYTDIKVERSDRQWFVTVGKPTSAHCIEIGMKSHEGYFVKIARSGRVEFPRREPVGESPVAWLTVRPMTGEVEPADGPHFQGGGAAAGPGTPDTQGDGEAPHAGGGWGFHAEAGTFASGTDWQAEWHSTSAVLEREWVEERDSFEWVGPLSHSRWEAGPFPLQIEAPGRVEEHFEGGVTVYSIAGGKRVSFGPWQVVIRGLRGWAEGRVLGTWEVHKSWATEGGHERWGERTVFGPVRGLGGSELFGASERRWMVGSERRLGGASELYRLGASEMRYGGASEYLYLGASEYRYAGASEWRYGGASEWTYRGGSESRLGGASEQRFRGGSEHFLGGSEGWHAGGEEAGFGGASEYRPLGGDAPPQWPAVP